LKQVNGYVRIDKQVSQVNKAGAGFSLFALAYCSALKSGDRFTDEQAVLHYEASSLGTQQVKLLGPKSDALKLFANTTGAEESKTGDGPDGGSNASSNTVKSTFKIEINEEERKIRD
jgi:hypothetical protein